MGLHMISVMRQGFSVEGSDTRVGGCLRDVSVGMLLQVSLKFWSSPIDQISIAVNHCKLSIKFKPYFLFSLKVKKKNIELCVCGRRLCVGIHICEQMPTGMRDTGSQGAEVADSCEHWESIFSLL